MAGRAASPSMEGTPGGRMAAGAWRFLERSRGPNMPNSSVALRNLRAGAKVPGAVVDRGGRYRAQGNAGRRNFYVCRNWRGIGAIRRFGRLHARGRKAAGAVSAGGVSDHSGRGCRGDADREPDLGAEADCARSAAAAEAE